MRTITLKVRRVREVFLPNGTEKILDKSGIFILLTNFNSILYWTF
ncbi:MAG: hypothetical protein V2G33_05540 [bacterium JZ-2024 1]